MWSLNTKCDTEYLTHTEYKSEQCSIHLSAVLCPRPCLRLVGYVSEDSGQYSNCSATESEICNGIQSDVTTRPVKCFRWIKSTKIKVYYKILKWKKHFSLWFIYDGIDDKFFITGPSKSDNMLGCEGGGSTDMSGWLIRHITCRHWPHGPALVCNGDWCHSRH